MAQAAPQSGANLPSAFPLPTIAEDTLQYTLHLPASSSSSTTNPEENQQADATALATLISAYVSSLLTQPWLWNKDAWELKVANQSKLEGVMRVGDAVDDEWLVVWLLKQVSKRWPLLVISIRDSDGEFLLIEAAHELPEWVSPDNAENRLWLSGGDLYLIPLSVTSNANGRPRQVADDQYDGSGRIVDTSAGINEADAIAAVRTGRYKAPDGVQRAIEERISCYPAALTTHQQRTKAYLPVSISRALSADPSLIQRAVEGFYVRDPAQLRAASRMTHFPPAPAILSSVLMTRAAYAQLQGQVFHPPRVFGPEWHVRKDDNGDNDHEYRWRDLGVKIATGFEIMYREGGRKGRVADNTASVQELKADPEYRKYISDLQRAGYFGNEVQDSARWNEQESDAAKGWVAARSSDTTQQRPSFAYLVDHAVETAASTPVSKLEVSKDAPEDNDKWLEVDPEELDNVMMRAAGVRAGVHEDASAEIGASDEQGKALADLASKVQEFIGGSGDMLGARFADELSDEDMDSDDEEEDPEETRKAAMDKLVPPLPAEEWGRRAQAPLPDDEEEDVGMKAVKTRPRSDRETELTDSLLPKSMRPPVFSKPEYDGVVSESSDEDDEDDADVGPAGSVGRRVLGMRWADTAPTGASIEEIDDAPKQSCSKDKRVTFNEQDIDEMMRQRVWGGGDNDAGEDGNEQSDAGDEMDVDMDNEEEDFVNFARKALGISEDQWEDIVSSRRARGAFVPSGPSSSGKFASKATPSTGGANKSLNSFESVMAAMDAELARGAHSSSGAPSVSGSTKPTSVPSPGPPGTTSGAKTLPPLPIKLPTEAEFEAMDDEEMEAMDRELRAALRGAGVNPDDEGDGLELGEDDPAEANQLQGDAAREYAMMRELLASFQAQGGQAGVVGNLFGRLGEERK